MKSAQFKKVQWKIMKKIQQTEKQVIEFNMKLIVNRNIPVVIISIPVAQNGIVLVAWYCQQRH